jgi:hypothetical protein
MVLFPFKKSIINAMLNFGGTLIHMWTWSDIRYPSTSSTPFWPHNWLIISPTDFRNLPHNRILRYLGTITTCYLQSHLTCDKLCQSCIGSSSSSAPWTLSRRKNLFYFSPERESLSGSSTRGGGYCSQLSDSSVSYNPMRPHPQPLLHPASCH